MKRLTALLAVAVVASGCSALGLRGACNGTEVRAEFEQVGDLVKNANVQSSDVVIGTVTGIELDEKRWLARVTMCLEPQQAMPKATIAVVRTTSLLGEKFVDLRIQEAGPPFLQDGDVLSVTQTSKAAELEDVFARLSAVLGTGNLEDLNRFVAAQARILGARDSELRRVLKDLRKFTDVLAGRRKQLAGAIDSLDVVARNVLDESKVLERFLTSFARSSSVLADHKKGLQDLVVALDGFSRASSQLLNATEGGLDTQFEKLRPVLRTAVANSHNVRKTLQTLATFSEWFPESIPGDYVQLDVCREMRFEYSPGVNCVQADDGDGRKSPASRSGHAASSTLEFILTTPLRGRS